MKFKKIYIALLCAVCCFFGLFTGCTYSRLKTMNGNWELNTSLLEEVRSDWLSAITTATVSIDRNKAYVFVELKEECESCSVKTGNYEVVVDYVYSSVSGYFSGGEGRIEFDIYDDENELMLRNVSATVGEKTVHDSLYFKKAGGEVNIPDKPDNPDNPNPDKPVGESKFSAIKAAYKNAGYNVELEDSESLDQSSKMLINSLKTQYAALGYDMGFIGKNLDNPLNAEMYMLMSTKTEAEAKELQRGFEGVYKTAQKGRDIIIYIWTLGTPNFSYFNQAVN